MNTYTERPKNIYEEKKLQFAIMLTLAALGAFVLVASLIFGGVKMWQFAAMGAAYENFAPPPETITTAVVEKQNWEITLNSVGSVTAVNGATISAEHGGNIESIAFKPGSIVNEGDLLVQQDVTTEKAQLRAALASAELAKISLERSKELLSKKLTSQSAYDSAAAEYKRAVAQADNIRSLISEKTIRAPFAGRVGVQNIYAGQYLNPGQVIVSLQSLDQLYVNFNLPQRYIRKIEDGMTVRIEADALPDEIVSGKIIAVNPETNISTRNTAVQAIVPNNGQKLLPGMFVNVTVILPEKDEVLSVPATAVVHAPFGASVFVVDEKTDKDSGEKSLVARQQFVKLGRTQGDFVVVTSGLNEQDKIVSTGAFKLHNGQTIVENNELAPKFELNPAPADS